MGIEEFSVFSELLTRCPTIYSRTELDKTAFSLIVIRNRKGFDTYFMFTSASGVKD